MSSVEALARWLQEKPPENAGTTKVHQIRLDHETSKTLGYLARRFGMPKATLAQDLLRAAIKDTLDITPGNTTLGQQARFGDRGAMDAIEEGADPDFRFHEMGNEPPEPSPTEEDLIERYEEQMVERNGEVS